MKFTIQQHEEHLANMAVHLNELRDNVRRATQDYERAVSQINKLKQQISRAKRLKKDGFDENRFAAI